MYEKTDHQKNFERRQRIKDNDRFYGHNNRINNWVNQDPYQYQQPRDFRFDQSAASSRQPRDFDHSRGSRFDQSDTSSSFTARSQPQNAFSASNRSDNTSQQFSSNVFDTASMRSSLDTVVSKQSPQKSPEQVTDRFPKKVPEKAPEPPQGVRPKRKLIMRGRGKPLAAKLTAS